MTYSKSQRSQIDQLRERYRKRRRRQLATATGIAIILIVGMAVLAGLAMLIRSCVRADSAVAMNQVNHAQPDSGLPHKVNVFGVEIAPWLAAMGEGSLLIAGDTDKTPPSYPSYPVNYLALYDCAVRQLEQKSMPPAWSVPIDGSLTDLKIVDGSAITCNQSLADPPAFEISGYKISNGDLLWNHTIDGAMSGQMTGSGKVVCVSYLLPDGYRLAGYNCTSGSKAWGKKVGISELPISIDADDDYVAYFCGSEFGLYDAGTGKELRSLDLGGLIVDYALDPASKSIFLIIALTPTSYVVKYLPYRNGYPLDLISFESLEDDHTLINIMSRGNRALLAYKPESMNGRIRLAGLEAGATNPVFDTEISSGYVSDIVTLPVAGAEFLIAVNQYEPSRRTSGWGRVYRIGFSDGQAKETGAFNQQVSWLASIDSGCLELLHGGRVLAYLPVQDQSVEIANLNYPVLSPLINNSGSLAAILSYPAGYLSDQTGCKMQILILD